MEFWDSGIVEFWDSGIVEFWDSGILCLCDSSSVHVKFLEIRRGLRKWHAYGAHKSGFALLSSLQDI